MVRKDRRILSFEYHIFVSPAKGPVAFATGPGVRLFAINLIVALDDGGNLCPGRGAAGDQVAVVISKRRQEPPHEKHPKRRHMSLRM